MNSWNIAIPSRKRNLMKFTKYSYNFEKTYREVKQKMNTFWSIVYFWEMTRFWWNFWWRSGPITSFFCTYFQVHRTCFKKVKSKNAFFHFFKNVKKHKHDGKNSSSQLLALWIFFIFWIRVKALDCYFSAIQNVIWSQKIFQNVIFLFEWCN